MTPTTPDGGAYDAPAEVADGHGFVADVTVHAEAESDSHVPTEHEKAARLHQQTADIGARAQGVVAPPRVVLTPELRTLAWQRRHWLEAFQEGPGLLALLQARHCRADLADSDALLVNPWVYEALQHLVLRLRSLNLNHEFPTHPIPRSIRGNVRQLLTGLQRDGLLRGSADEATAESFYQAMCSGFVRDSEFREALLAPPVNEYAHVPQLWEEMQRQNSTLTELARLAMEKYGRPRDTIDDLCSRQPNIDTFFVLQALGHYAVELHLSIGRRTRRECSFQEQMLLGALEKAGALDPGWEQRPGARQSIAETWHQRD